MNIWIWLFIVAIASLGSAQYAIHETKQRELNLCEEPYSFEIRELLLPKYCPVQTKLGHGWWKYRNIWKCC
ncbi:MAG: hypothetical protein E2O72_07540 [Candidatus Dadabacteria bacterium]|nr:MAG: hypothetical protein E2O72_07540 [Candidatus Dadabacteria bacterium]